MPKYDIQDASGKIILTLEGNTPPTEADIDEALGLQNTASKAGQQMQGAWNDSQKTTQALIDSLSGRNAPISNPDLPTHRIDELPEMKQDVSYFGGFKGMVKPEEERARVMANWEKIPLGDEMVHPVLGRIKKTGGISYQQIDPDEKAGFFDNVATAGQIVRNLPARLAQGFAANDLQSAREGFGGIAKDVDTYGKPLKAASQTVGAAGARTLPVIGVAAAPFTGGASLLAIGAAGVGGEALAEKIEGRDLNPIELGVAGLTAPIGMNNLKVGSGIARSLIQGAKEGALIGGTNVAGRKLDDIVHGRGVQFGQDDLANFGLTTAFGVAGRGAEAGINKGMEILNKSKAPPPMANVATQNAANAGSDANALQASLNEVTAPSNAQQSANVFEQALNQKDVSIEVQKAIELQEVNKTIKQQIAEADTATEIRRSQAGADLLKEQLAQEQSISKALEERKALNQQRELADIQAEEIAFPELQEKFPELSPQAQRMYDEYGRIDPGLMSIVGSGAAGGIGGSAYGATQGDTPEERLNNALKYGGLGMVGAPALVGLGKASAKMLAKPRAREFIGDVEHSMPETPEMIQDIVPAIERKKPAPAVFLGIQEGFPSEGIPDIELYNLTEDFAGYPKNSTVSRQTLESNGAVVDPRPLPEQPRASLQDELSVATPKEYPKDIEFLYRDTYKTKDGIEKTVNNFQIDKTPENPRGITADDAVLKERGYSQDQINKMADDLIAGRGSPFIGGAEAGAIINPLSVIAEARKRLNAMRRVNKVEPAESVFLPETESGEYIKQTAEKMIRDTDNPIGMRKTMADSGDIIGQKFKISKLRDEWEPLTLDEVRNIAASPSLSENERLVANAIIRNKLVASGEAVESAKLGINFTNNFSDAATVLNIAKLFKSPEDYAKVLDDQIHAINGRNLSQQDRGIVTALAQKRIAAEDALAQAKRQVYENFDDASIQAFKDAELNLGKAERDAALKEASLLPKGWGDAITGPIKTGLLGARTITYAATANVGQYAIDNMLDSITTVVDAARSKVTGGKRAVMSLNPLPSAGEIKRSASLFARNLAELVNGPNERSFAEGIASSVGTKPLEDIKQGFGAGQSMAVKRETIIDPVTGEKYNVEYVSLGDRAQRLMRGLTGLGVAPMQRLINLSDNFVRGGREYRLLLEQGKLRGLEGEALNQFMVAPPTDAVEAASAVAARTVMQDNGLLTKAAQDGVGVFRRQLKKMAVNADGKFGEQWFKQGDQLLVALQTTQLPFMSVPFNSIDRLMTMGFPPWGLTKAMAYVAEGNTAMAERVIAEMIVGTSLIGAGAWLYRNGLASEPSVKDPKERSIAYQEIGGPGKLNKSALSRYLRSLDKADLRFKSGDVVIDYPQLTTAGGVLALAIKAESMSKADPKKPRPLVGKDNMEFAWNMLAGSPAVATGLSPLMNASAALETLANSDDPDKIGRWAYNTMRAAVAPVLPRTLDDFAAIHYGDVPQIRDKDSLVKTFENLVKYKTQRLNEKDIVWTRDMFGRKIDASRGMNDYYAAFADPFKSAVLNKEPWEISVMNAYKESGGNPDAYPSIPSTKVDLLGQTFKLDAKDAETVAIERGILYRKALAGLTSNPKWEMLKPQAKVLILKSIYSKADAWHAAKIRQKPAFIQKYENKAEGKTTKRLAIEEAVSK
jgi:hypothetical protein